MNTETELSGAVDALDTMPRREFVDQLRNALAHDLAAITELEDEAAAGRSARDRAVFALAGLAAAAAAFVGVALHPSRARHAPKVASSTTLPAGEPVSFNTDGSTFVTVDVVGPSRIPPRPDKWRAIGGNIRIDGDTLTFSDIRTTLVACANTRNFTGLGGTDHFRVTGNHLVLTAGDGTEFHFHPARFPADDNVVRVTGNGKSKVLDDGAAFIYAVENAAPIHSQARTTELGPTYEILFSTSPSAAPDVIVDVHDYGCKTATIGSTTFDGRVIAQLARKALA